MLVRSADEGCIAWSAIGKVLTEWREPQHEEFEPRTAWSLHNAYTEVAKTSFERNAIATSAATVRLTDLFDQLIESRN